MIKQGPVFNNWTAKPGFERYVLGHTAYATKLWKEDKHIAVYFVNQGPKLTVFHDHNLGYFRRSLFASMAEQAMTAIELVPEDQRAEFLAELWERCERNRRNRHAPFWSDL